MLGASHTPRAGVGTPLPGKASSPYRPLSVPHMAHDARRTAGRLPQVNPSLSACGHAAHTDLEPSVSSPPRSRNTYFQPPSDLHHNVTLIMPTLHAADVTLLWQLREPSAPQAMVYQPSHNHPVFIRTPSIVTVRTTQTKRCSRLFSGHSMSLCLCSQLDGRSPSPGALAQDSGRHS